jgi:REP element-mobilizing transposase RayT
MPNYRRNRVPGRTYFFTVNLFDRRSDLLVAQIDVLRATVRNVRAHLPFHIDGFCPIICIACGRCPKANPIFPIAGG